MLKQTTLKRLTRRLIRKRIHAYYRDIADLYKHFRYPYSIEYRARRSRGRVKYLGNNI